MPSLRSLTLLALLPAAWAHFTLDYPQTRGFDEDTEDQTPCGGFNTIGTRNPWYQSGGPVSIDSHHDTATVNIYIATVAAPGLDDFNTYPPLKSNLAIKGQGEFCFHAPTAESLANVRLADNTNATIMVEHISVHGRLYQCADVTLSNDASIGSNITCTDALTANAQAPAGNSSSSTSTSPTSSAQTSATSATVPAAATSRSPDAAVSLRAAGGLLSLTAAAVVMLF